MGATVSAADALPQASSGTKMWVETVDFLRSFQTVYRMQRQCTSFNSPFQAWIFSVPIMRCRKRRFSLAEV